jgi:hypothetical protein
VHVLGAYFKDLGPGVEPFGSSSPKICLAYLKAWLHLLHVPDAHLYRTHDLRRGHCRDLQERGAQLFEILSAGEWSSPAFLKYMAVHDLERDTVIEAHLADSSEDEC